MTHDELVKRAIRWLRGTGRCNVVFSGIASCSEIPDAIGWGADGSIVVECKASIMDFYADKQKYMRWRKPGESWAVKGNGRVKNLKGAGYESFMIPNMGTRRFFLSEVLSAEHIADRPDHGLLQIDGRRIRVVVDAPMRSRDAVDLENEIRLLRLGIVHAGGERWLGSRWDDTRGQQELFAA